MSSVVEVYVEGHAASGSEFYIELRPFFSFHVYCDFNTNKFCINQTAIVINVLKSFKDLTILKEVSELRKRMRYVEGHRVGETNTWYIVDGSVYTVPSWGALVNFNCPSILLPFVEREYRKGGPETPAICRLKLKAEELLRERKEYDGCDGSGYCRQAREQYIKTLIIPNVYSSEVVKVKYVEYREWDDNRGIDLRMLVIPKMKIEFFPEYYRSAENTAIRVTTSGLVVVDDEGNYVIFDSKRDMKIAEEMVEVLQF